MLPRQNEIVSNFNLKYLSQIYFFVFDDTQNILMIIWTHILLCGCLKIECAVLVFVRMLNCDNLLLLRKNYFLPLTVSVLGIIFVVD